MNYKYKNNYKMSQIQIRKKYKNKCERKKLL